MQPRPFALGLTTVLAASSFLIAASCHHKEPADTWSPDFSCPGDPACPSADGELEVGAGKVDVTPTCFETWQDLNADWTYSSLDDTFSDCGCDRLCPGDKGYTAPDEGEGDGEFEALWMAGFNIGRAAAGIHDPLWTRAIVLRKGESSVAIVSVDCVGLFYNYIQTIQAAIVEAGIDVDLVIVTATHVHEAPDTMGIWGRRVAESGLNPAFMDKIKNGAVEAVRQAANTRPAIMSAGKADVSAYSHDKGTRNFIRDSRDPKVVEENLYVAQFTDKSSGDTIATLVNWGNHPEAVASENLLLTSDYVDTLRTTVEEGAVWDTYSHPGVGGTTVFVEGMVGGLMTPLSVEMTDPDGVTFTDSNFDKAEALGKTMGDIALDAIESAEVVDSPDLSFRGFEFFLPLENFTYQAMYLLGVIDREAYNYDPTRDFDDTNIPELKTAMDYVTVGSVNMLTIPGELFPELAIGGYDGSHLNSPTETLISEDNENPPDLSKAPAGPYIEDRMPLEYDWILGLANDELGYIMPAYDFEVDAESPYLGQPPGDHYEETNSTGPQAGPLVEAAAIQLLEWKP